ncbi:MAG: nitrophenyl compound nitroreductase subunit ArsF family protein [Bacteroidales bacterium]
MKITLSAIIVLLIAFTSCSGTSKKSEATSVTTQTVKDYVEVIYFHGKQRCITCNAIENLTKEVLQESFSEEVKKGKIQLRVIDISEKENEAIADKYEVSWSSLYINKWSDNQEKRENLTDFGFSYAKSSPDLFKEGIKEKISTLLN